ncbi:cytoplasmic protein NCK2 isoform X1 [Rhipicephalus sanguineus]|uniref:Uncharacterized protein n=1 Tax=Rhipicephalus sanguineus TaxID=34632 RepID=A0A9D4Q0G5_RHISA|nr:cytoplasmic protein NCK2 isoform X1 [Rhipicephalus sanguineus]KAH7962240.1 hypothetical protein HPB52_014967 [Rhipicephalus sanguineus]
MSNSKSGEQCMWTTNGMVVTAAVIDPSRDAGVPGKAGNEETYVVAKYDYVAQGSQELSLRKHERLVLLDDSKHWWKVQNAQRQAGFVPSNYVKREKPSLFDSIRRRVRKRSEAKLSPASSPVAADEPGGGGGGPAEACGTALVRYNYEAKQADEISLVKGGRVLVMEKSSDGWWKGEHCGRLGWFPSNYVQEEASSPDEAATPTDGPVVLETVVALYSFASQNEEELSFTKGEQLEVIEKPENDPDWWKARNQSGDTGLVPKNYVQVVVTPSPASTTPKPSTPVPQPPIAPRPELNAKEWYFGSISRSQCDQVLNDHAVDGDFLIRDSETNVGDLSVSLKAPQRNKHFRVHVEDGVYCIGQRRFSNLDDLVEHYKRAPIYTSPKGDKMYLVRPFRKP